jgi:hypothetical protein
VAIARAVTEITRGLPAEVRICARTGIHGAPEECAVDEYETRRDREKTAVAERDGYGRLVALGVIALWLLTMLLVLGPSAARALF